MKDAELRQSDDLDMGLALRKYNRNIGDYIMVIVKDIVRKTLEEK